ncbi:MAG: VanW family protein [Firmicutes bacterium]|nr:VanW family protein [Bacillota bacterium]
MIEQIDLYVGNDSNSYNAGVAADIINGYVLYPGEVFSFNTVVGMRTSAKGFINGIMYVTVDGEKATKEAMGSGVCRISTALFQAANDVGFDIIERHNHAYESTYAALGNDAAVMYGILDNQFRNNCEFPIRIKCWLENRRVIVVQFYRIVSG